MSSIDHTRPSDVKNLAGPQEGKFDPILGRIDLIAIFATVLGLCLLGVGAVVMAIIEVAKLVGGLWSDSFDRWLVVIFCLAILWVIARRKKLCIF